MWRNCCRPSPNRQSQTTENGRRYRLWIGRVCTTSHSLHFAHSTCPLQTVQTERIITAKVSRFTEDKRDRFAVDWMVFICRLYIMICKWLAKLVLKLSKNSFPVHHRYIYTLLRLSARRFNLLATSAVFSKTASRTTKNQTSCCICDKVLSFESESMRNGSATPSRRVFWCKRRRRRVAWLAMTEKAGGIKRLLWPETIEPSWRQTAHFHGRPGTTSRRYHHRITLEYSPYTAHFQQ